MPRRDCAAKIIALAYIERCDRSADENINCAARSRPQSASGFHEFKRHAIALADGKVLVAIGATERERRRQRPDALRIIFDVGWIRVDFRSARKPEARGL